MRVIAAPCRASVAANMPGLERPGSGGSGYGGGGGVRLSWLWDVVSGDCARGFVHVLVARCRTQFAAGVSGLGERGSCGGGSGGDGGGGVGRSRLLIIASGGA